MEPSGPWWPRLRDKFVVAHVDAPTRIYGAPVENWAHKTDIIRLLVVQHYGGIYLDTDVYL